MSWHLKPTTSDGASNGANGELKGEFRVVCDSAEDLLRATADLGGERMAAVRARVDESLKNLKTRVSESRILERGKADARAADACVHANPWKSAGIAAGVGLLAGALLSRR